MLRIQKMQMDQISGEKERQTGRARETGRKRETDRKRDPKEDRQIGNANEKKYGQKEIKIGRDTCRERGQEESGKEERERPRGIKRD